jgi:hypothetical protein
MIDDVEYLVANAEKDSQIVYIDSSLRNRMFYPNANEYTIEFDQPFKLVYGFDVLDATVPVTMYNVDIYNCTMSYSVVVKNAASVVPIDPEKYVGEISTCKSFVEIFNRDVETFVVVGDESVLNGYIGGVTTPDENYVMYYRKTITTPEIAKKNIQAESEFYTFKFNFTEYCIRRIAGNQPIIDILESGEYSMIINTNDVEVVYFEKNIIDQTTFGAITTANAHIVTISNYIRSIEPGNYDILSLMSDMNDMLNTTKVDVEPSTPVPKKQAKLIFSSAHLVLINAAKGDLVHSLGFDTYPAATATGSNYKGWTFGDNFLVFGSVFDPTDSRYKIRSPGLISLLGERFAILRIKELEDHLYGSYSYMRMTPGIGMFKMAAAFGGITNLRFDYTSVVRKPFHPIGKLSKLSIRFETSSGRLYDFKGVNHQLMVNIKFYVPTQKVKFTKSILNPNYDPNVMDYMAKNRTIQNREDSDDEEEFDQEEYYQMYKKELDKYNYSSSEEEEDDDDSEEDVENEIVRDRFHYQN